MRYCKICGHRLITPECPYAWKHRLQAKREREKKKERKQRLCIVCWKPLSAKLRHQCKIHPGKCKKKREKQLLKLKLANIRLQQIEREKMLQYQRSHGGSSLPLEEYKVRTPIKDDEE